MFLPTAFCLLPTGPFFVLTQTLRASVPPW